MVDILEIGNRVFTASNRCDTLKYHGTTRFASGIWAGVELDDTTGKNDGSVSGIRYFTCPTQQGVFVKRDSLQKVNYESSIKSSIKPAFDLHLGDEFYYVTPEKEARIGHVRFVGLTEFASGTWVGIELHEAKGLNDREVDGKR